MADIFLRFPGGLSRALTLSYDDGVDNDRRLIALMRQYGLKGTFNLNSGLYAAEDKVYPPEAYHRRMTRRACLETYAGSDIEVAVHGLTHPFLDHLPVTACLREILEDRENLEADFGGIVQGMAYPFGTFNDNVVDCLRLSGIVYARTTIPSEKFELPADWLRLKPTCHHKHPRLQELTEQFLAGDIFGRPSLFYLWGHSYEFERDNNWEVIEDFAKRVGGRDDVWYATNIEVYRYVQAYQQLRFSADGRTVENPSAQDVWFHSSAAGTVCVPAGGSKRLD